MVCIKNIKWAYFDIEKLIYRTEKNTIVAGT